ncbi:hypothetical protein PUN28_003666 [Cardiocondyla obscurior]|uniref:Uncharacterized protein n=1 Tax=Cardiocondyla obscurior TaxID=286306 RepID=A0AAW2GP06_9HYME
MASKEPAAGTVANTIRVTGEATTSTVSATLSTTATSNGLVTSGQTQRPVKTKKVRPAKILSAAPSAAPGRTSATGRPFSTSSGRAAATGTEGSDSRRPMDSRSKKSSAPTKLLKDPAGKNRGPPVRRGSTIKAMEVLRSPQLELKTVAGLERDASVESGFEPERVLVEQVNTQETMRSVRPTCARITRAVATPTTAPTPPRTAPQATATAPLATTPVIAGPSGMTPAGLIPTATIAAAGRASEVPPVPLSLPLPPFAPMIMPILAPLLIPPPAPSAYLANAG